MAQNNDGPGKRLKREQAKYKPTPFVAKAAEDSYNYWQKNSVNGVLPKSKIPKRIEIPKHEYEQKYRAMEDSLGTSYYTHSLLDQLKQGVPAEDALKSLSSSFSVDHIAKPVNMSSMRKNVAPVRIIVTTDKYGQKISVPIYAQPKTYVPDKYDIERGFWDKVGDQISSIDRNYIDPFRQGITPTYVKPKIEEVRKTVSNFIDKYNPFNSTPTTTTASNKEGQLINSTKKTPAPKPQAPKNVPKIIAPVQRPKANTQSVKPKPVVKVEQVAKKDPVVERNVYEDLEPIQPRQAPVPSIMPSEIVPPVVRPAPQSNLEPQDGAMGFALRYPAQNFMNRVKARITGQPNMPYWVDREGVKRYPNMGENRPEEVRMAEMLKSNLNSNNPEDAAELKRIDLLRKMSPKDRRRYMDSESFPQE